MTLEEIFTLTHHCGISYTEAMDMEVPVRKWWIQRTMKERERENEANGGAAPPPGRTR